MPVPDLANPAPVASPTGHNPANDLEVQIMRTGDDLLAGLTGVVRALGLPPGPQAMASHLGIDKVLASRVLKAIDHADPLAVVHRAPGPEPLRRLIKASARKGVSGEIIGRATAAVNGFETLIRDTIGDRSSLETIVSSWVPEARREFELRRKQAAFRAMSQLKGVEARTTVATVLLAPSDDGEKIDVIWVSGVQGLQRLRPGAVTKFATRRMDEDEGGRSPTDLDGMPVDGLHRLQLEPYCSTPMPQLDIRRVGKVVHYTLGDTGYGPRSGVDVMFAEANFAEIDRYVAPEDVGRKRAYVFAEAVAPSKVMQFDVFVHHDLYPQQRPSLLIYDTAFEGVADINDPARDIDQLDMMESIEYLGMGIGRCRSADVPRYASMLQHVCDRLDWDGDALRAYRCRIDYPLYGSQIAMTFNTIARGS